MNHSVKRRRQALHKTHHHYYLNISVEAANVSNWRIESNRKHRFGSQNRIESKLFARIGMLYTVYLRYVVVSRQWYSTVIGDAASRCGFCSAPRTTT